MWLRQQSRGLEALAGPARGVLHSLSPLSLSLLHPSFWPRLLLKQTPAVWASGSRRGAVFRWVSHPFLSCLVPVDPSRAAESVFEHLPRGMAAGGCGSLLKVLGGQG